MSRTRVTAVGSSSSAPRTEVSASRSRGGTRPSTRGGTGATDKARLPVPGDDQVDVRGDLAVEVERHPVLAELLQGILQLDPAPVDVHLVLEPQRGGDVVVGDGAEDLVLGSDLEPDHDGLVVDDLRQLLGLVALLGLAPGDRLAQPLRLRLNAARGDDGQLAGDQEVAPVAVGHLLDVAGLADVLDVLDQHHSQADLSSDAAIVGSLCGPAVAPIVRAPRRETRWRRPARPSVSAVRRSRSKTLSPRSRAARCSSTTGSGQASTNTLTVRIPSARRSRSPMTGI